MSKKPLAEALVDQGSDLIGTSQEGKARSTQARATATGDSSNGEDLGTDDPSSWVELYGDRLYQFALSRVRDQALAEDLVQDTFMSAIRAIESFEGRSSIQTWLRTILKNKIVDHFRKSTRRGSEVRLEDYEEIPAVGFGTLGIWNVYVPNWGKSPDAALENDQFLKVVESCLGKLPERHREVFQLKFLKDLEAEEICKILSLSSSNYWVILHRGRLALRQCVQENWA